MNMEHSQMDRIYLYTRFERFWHWAQALLIVILAVTGLEIHGVIGLAGFQLAVEIHNGAAWTWFVLYAFILFWHATTGQWKHYIPTTQKLLAVARYYAVGIFRGERHPVPKSERSKHNPLQRMAYLGITLVLVPFQVATGFLLYTYNRWAEWGIGTSLGTVATLHTLGAFGLIAFIVGHIYMTTTGHSVTCHLSAMCSGWEEVPAEHSKVSELERAA